MRELEALAAYHEKYTAPNVLRFASVRSIRSVFTLGEPESSSIPIATAASGADRLRPIGMGRRLERAQRIRAPSARALTGSPHRWRRFGPMIPCLRPVSLASVCSRPDEFQTP